MIFEVLLLLILVGLFLYSTTWKASSLPPGTFGVPVLGNLPPRHLHYIKYLRDLKEKYGNIICTKWGSRVVIVLADYQVIKKAMNHPCMQGRVDNYSIAPVRMNMNLGLVMADGHVWYENRIFLIRALRELGVAKMYLENAMQEEIKMLVDHLEAECLNKPTELDFNVDMAALNVIWLIMAGKRYDANDDEMIQYNKLVTENFKLQQGPVFVVDVMPWIARIIPHSLLNKLLGVDKMVNNVKSLHSLYYKIIEEHKKNLDPEKPKDVIDYYLIEMEARKNDPDTTFRADLKDLLTLMNNMFVAGSHTTALIIRWIFLYLAMEQDVQRKIQTLIDEVVPRDRLPSLDDRENLAYLNATILDVLRLASLEPVSIPHRASDTVTFEGYTIPKDAAIIPCLELCHRDPAFWARPDNLYPEHFLDKDGKLNSKQDGFLAFGIGRRQCLGESLARKQLFLFASALLQRFTIEPPPGVTLSTDTARGKKNFNVPKHIQVVLRKRI